jgi:hypothetical protein
MATAYNASPAPTQGNGAFGLVPGQIQTPPSLWDQLNQNVPDYGALTTSATGNINSMLNGQVSPSTMTNLSNQAAARGISLGQPNSPMSNVIGLNLLGTTSEGLQQQGLTDYNSFTGTAGGLQESPDTMANIANINSINAAAPNPSSAAAYSKSLFDEQLAAANPNPYAVGAINPATGQPITQGWNYGPPAITSPGAGSAGSAQYYIR